MSILVVDDEASVRTALADFLGQSGYSVVTAANGYEALEMISRVSPEMVITDVKMPQMSGLELLEEIKRKDPLLPVLMVTAYGTIDSAVQAMKLGAADYILKPFSFEALESAVKKEQAAFRKRPEARATEGFPLYSESKKIVTRSPQMKELLALAQGVAGSVATVLIQGESGTGKELLARFIHQNSSRRGGPLVAINCAALPENLLESELFGHEKGAFTGAIAKKKGKFELAHQGTILLDEVSEMAPSLQAKLLRFLQEGEVDRVGGVRPIPVDVRVIATTNRDLKEAMAQGHFREDLYYRLNVIPLKIPPLRERKGDISLLVGFFVERYAQKHVSGTGFQPVDTPAGCRSHKVRVSEEAVSRLMAYDWPGNVRELENVVQRGVLLAKGEIIQPHHLIMEGPAVSSLHVAPASCRSNRLEAGSTIQSGAGSGPIEPTDPAPGVTVRDMERQLIFRTLDQVEGNRTRAAKLLGVSIRTLRNKLREYRDEKSCLGHSSEESFYTVQGVRSS